MIMFTVNGVQIRVAPDDPATLLELLRGRLHLTAARMGCGVEQCGACMVLVDDAPSYACTRPANALAGRAVMTLEGLGSREAPHPVQQAFAAEQATQCAYCLPGIMVSTVALLARNPDPSRAEIVTALEPHLCRCGAHPRIMRAVERAAELARTPA